VLERLAESGHIRRKDRLLDYGCGKGRVPLFMASAIGCRAAGIDHAQKLVDIAVENRRSARLGDRVTFACARAEQYEIRDENVFFFFNPFSEKIFDSVLRRLELSRLESPRPMKVICYFPSEAYIQCLDALPGLKPVDDIDCNDLFSSHSARERILVYRF
jgi:SAM-dependent methyltransferase